MVMKDKFDLYILFSLLLVVIFAGCRDESLVSSSVDVAEGEVTIRFYAGERPVIVSRSDDAEEVLDNVVVYALDGDGKVLKSIYQQLDNRDYVTMYLPSGTAELLAVCNYDYPDNLLKLETKADIKAVQVQINRAEEAYKGCYVLTGTLALPAGELIIPVHRIAARFDVEIYFSPQDETGAVVKTDAFDIVSVTLCDAPKVTWLMRKGYEAVDDPATNNIAVDETTQAPLLLQASADAMVTNTDNPKIVNKDAFLPEQELNFKEYESPEDVGVGILYPEYVLSFDMFENRRGGLDTKNEEQWSSLIGGDKNHWQLLKKKFADGDEGDDTDGFPKASYLKITGIYRTGVGTAAETAAEVSYYIYLGGNNYSDYNVFRNYHYKYTVTIKSGRWDGADTRVEGIDLTGTKVYASLDEPLDAHFNAVKTMVYSSGGCRIYVKNPDQTPWLELSTSEAYLPNKVGSTSDEKTAQYSLVCDPGITYVYIHTDEYIREQNSPLQNDLQTYRTGTICCRDNNTGQLNELEVKQYPAQLVILDYYDALTVKHVKDTFFVERILEEKNIEWGFKEYWSLTMDNLITTGQWDGLSNTRKLFETALHGDGFEGDDNDPGLDLPGLEDPAYPGATGPHGEQGWAVPTNVAVGYAIAKNRDRNGNGRIDYDEIVWYMPAMKELEAIYEHLERKEVDFEATTEKFASSTPSAAGPNAANPGRFYYIKMATGDISLAMRNRSYNVLCCRRKGAWQGNADAGGGGEVTIPDGGYGDEDFIMPKTETSN